MKCVCKNCGTEFESKSNRMYCSDSCRLESFYKKHGGASAYRKSHYVPSRLRGRIAKCKWCGKEFAQKNENVKFCSDKCKFKSWTANKKRKRAMIDMSTIGCWGLPIKTCVRCGKKFSPRSLTQDTCTVCWIAPKYSKISSV